MKCENVNAEKAALLQELRELISESGGDADAIDLAAWLETWLESPLPELSGDTPAKALGNESGRLRLRDLLGRMRGGLVA